MPYFNSILGAVEQGGSTADLWAAYRNAVELAGGALGEASIFDMNVVAGYARGVHTAEGALAAAPGENPVDSTMWAWAPWAAGSTDAWTTDRYQVRYQATLTGPDGSETPVWGVTDWEGSLEGVTKDQLWARSLESAQIALDTGSPRVQAQLGMVEGVSLSGVSRVQVLRI
jgi:hypothetical protein